MEQDNKPYKPEQVAALLGSDVKTIYKAIADGQLPAFEVGRTVKLPKPAIDRLLKEGKVA